MAILLLTLPGCKVPYQVRKKENRNVPEAYNVPKDTMNSARTSWKDFFTDQDLVALIDTALNNNQELNIFMQEINIAKNEARGRKGQYLPFLDVGAGAGVDKVGRYTSQGASDAADDILPGKKVPESLPRFVVSADLSWEIDIWKKLRNARKSAVTRYLATTEGRNFMVSNLISEIAGSYYELMALDNQLIFLRQNIQIQQNALEIVKLEKLSAKVTELAVRKFEAEVLKNQSRQFAILQSITETENRLNFLVGRFPQPVNRNSQTFIDLRPDTVHAGIPFQLLENRADIRRAEKELAASRLDVRVAKANFYPRLMLSAGIGYEAFSPSLLLKAPESLIYTLAGQLITPLINRNAIKAEYYSANSRQVQAIFNYEKTLLNAYMEVANQLSNIGNLQRSFDLKSKQVQALTQAINISTVLFKSARADYMEVLMTQRDALESRFDLVETKMQQFKARVMIYRALGGGWQ
jgi:NodT family efflux transporter outer membrane factor (OMF) lipoprotein